MYANRRSHLTVFVFDIVGEWLGSVCHMCSTCACRAIVSITFSIVTSDDSSQIILKLTVEMFCYANQASDSTAGKDKEIL
jgi:hypothetical protein